MALNHEVLVDLFRKNPRLAFDLLLPEIRAELWQGGAIEPSTPLRTVDTALTEITPTEYDADLVVLIGEPPTLALIVEVQLSTDSGKRESWPAYVVGLHRRHRCPVVLVVVAVDENLARVCARPIPLGHPGFVLRPIIIGPERIPVVTDPDEARAAPEIVVLSTLAHGKGPDAARLVQASEQALSSVDPESARLYADLILASLAEPARSMLKEKLMQNYQYQSEWFREMYAQGLEAGRLSERAHVVLEVLRARGLDVPPEVEAYVAGVHDLDELGRLLRRALTVDRAAELMG